MTIRDSLIRVLHEYNQARHLPHAGNHLAAFIRHDIPQTITDTLELGERYKIKGSPGNGNWATIPWVAIFDRLITENAQGGYYLVFLFREDLSGVYLSLNQGVTTVREQYRADARSALRARTSDFLAQLGDESDSFECGPIDLKTTAELGLDYEAGSICARFYSRDAIPDEPALIGDLTHLLRLYFLLTDKAIRISHVEREDDEGPLGEEDLRLLRTHKRIERNQQLAKMAKTIHGYTCMVCNIDFGTVYGDIGKGYIEAHHLTPLGSLKGQKVTLDARKDFAVLCSNCHRMIHRSDLINDITTFKEKHYKRS